MAAGGFDKFATVALRVGQRVLPAYPQQVFETAAPVAPAAR